MTEHLPTTRSATGHCLCRAVSFRATEVPETIGVCHCEMCRRWTGSALVEVSVPEENVTWTGDQHIAKRATSPWAERAWCTECGTGLWFRMTQDGEWSGKYDIPLGIFDDPNGFTLTHEIYIDHKPDSFAYAGENHKRLTRAECVEKAPFLDNRNTTQPISDRREK